MVEIRELSDYDSPPPRYKSWLDELPFLHSYVPDQGETSTCTSHAITFAVSFLHIIESQKFSDLPGAKEAQDRVMPSQWVLSPQAPVDRVPILYAGRVVDDTYVEDDRGTAALRCPEIYEYCVDFGFTFKDRFNDQMSRNRFNSTPSSHEVPRVHIEDFQMMGSCVGANRVPIFKAIDKQVLVGLLHVTVSFEFCKHIYRKNTEKVIGCHAVAIVGYDAEWNLLQIYNSWGESGVPDRPGSLWVEADLLFGISRPLKSYLHAGPVDFSRLPRPRQKIPWKYNIGWGERGILGSG